MVNAYVSPGESVLPSSNPVTRTPMSGLVQAAELSTRSSGLMVRVLVISECSACSEYEVTAADDGV
jgi:hypothetical protein